jgi:hypothetical protein
MTSVQFVPAGLSIWSAALLGVHFFFIYARWSPINAASSWIVARAALAIPFVAAKVGLGRQVFNVNQKAFARGLGAHFIDT